MSAARRIPLLRAFQCSTKSTKVPQCYSAIRRPQHSRPVQVRYSYQCREFASHARFFATQSIVDEKIEEITELYATARDEFEIAAEETEKMTVYAADDRAAAREEFDKLQTAYNNIVEGPDAELGQEVKRRVGQRIRELENAVKNMEAMAADQD